MLTLTILYEFYIFFSNILLDKIDLWHKYKELDQQSFCHITYCHLLFITFTIVI